jgi:hypothetical protein
VELSRYELTVEMLGHESEQLLRMSIEVRVDPLTGHTSRILPARGLMPQSDFDLEAFADENQPSCPFCSERIEQLTPRLAPKISRAGRIVRGEAVLFPTCMRAAPIAQSRSTPHAFTYLGDTGRVEWLVSFAPLAPAELRAFIRGFVSPQSWMRMQRPSSRTG